MSLRPYLGEIKITFKDRFAYRTEFFTSLMSIAFNVLLFWFLWKAVFASSVTADIKGFTFPMMMTYVVVSSLMRSYGYPNMEKTMERDVRHGRIVVGLIRPVSYPLWRFSKMAAESLFVVVTSAAIGAAFAVLVFKIALPATWLFFVSAGLAFLVNYLLSFLTGLWAFWTTGSVWGVRLFRIVVADMLSGALIPLALLPGFLQKLSGVLPFKAAYDIPLSMYIGSISGAGIAWAILLQVFWIAALSALVAVGWRKGIRRVVVQGG